MKLRFNIRQSLIASAVFAITISTILWLDVFSDGIWAVHSIETFQFNPQECLKQGICTSGSCQLDLAECFDGRKRITIVLGESGKRDAKLPCLSIGDSFVFVDGINKKNPTDPAVIQLQNHQVRVLKSTKVPESE